MKFLIKQNLTSNDQNQRGLPESQTSYDVPNGTITGVAVIYLVINVLATLAGNSISTYLGNKPQRDIDKQNFTLKLENFKVQLLQRCLELDNGVDRKTSLQLLINTDFFDENEKKQLAVFINSSKDSIPKWKTKDIETLNTYLSNSNSGSLPIYYSPPVQQPNQTGTQASTNTPSTGGSTPRQH